MEEYSQLNWNDHSAILLSKLHNMFETHAFVDLTLVSDEGLSIQVHRVIVCAASQYFQNLLSQHPTDAHTTIILSDVSSEQLRALVKFIYKGTVSVPCSQLPVLLESATSMKIKGLADAIKCRQQQHDSRETLQTESEETLLKIVSVQSIAQMPSRSNQPMSLENNDVIVVKEEVDYDSDATVVYEPKENNWMSESGTAGSVMSEPRRVSLSNSSTTESPGEKSDLSSLKRKKNQHHSSNGNNIPTRPTLFKSKSLLEDEGSLSGDEGASGGH